VSHLANFLKANFCWHHNLIALDEQLKVAEENVELGKNTLEMITLQFSSAQVNSLAVQQAEAQKKTAELLIPLALQNIAIQENALSILCGNYPDKISRSESLKSVMPKDVFPTGVPAVLLSRRPSVVLSVLFRKTFSMTFSEIVVG